jgi:hypothetical protein
MREFREYSFLPRAQSLTNGSRLHSAPIPPKRLAFGESDEGDPWCIVCEREGERVLLHIARIDCSYVIARPGRSRLQRTASITAASDLALRWLDRELREHFRPGHAA